MENNITKSKIGCSRGCSKIFFRILGVIILLISLPLVLGAIGTVAGIIVINSEMSTWIPFVVIAIIPLALGLFLIFGKFHFT